MVADPLPPIIARKPNIHPFGWEVRVQVALAEGNRSLVMEARTKGASLGASRKIGHRGLVRKFPFFQSASSACKIHLRERWQGCGKMGEMGNGKKILSQIVSFFSNFSPISYEFHALFLYFPLGFFGIFSHLPVPLHFPPFPTIFPFPPFFFTSAASWLIRLRLTPTPEGAGHYIWTSGLCLRRGTGQGHDFLAGGGVGEVGCIPFVLLLSEPLEIV